jgi:DNA polymerase III delta prime subunit
MQSFTGGARVLIIRDAERISIAAANLMLKAIEESRGNTYFIFTTSSLGKIPSTVRSRSQTFSFSPLSPEEIHEILKLNNPDLLRECSSKILNIALTTGTISAALQTLAQGEKLFELEHLFDELKAGTPTAGFKLANFIHEQKAEGRASVLTLIDLTHRQLLSSVELKQRAWCLLLENLQTAERLIWDRHLNSQYLLANIFNSFLEQQTCRNKANQSEVTLNDLFEDSI